MAQSYKAPGNILTLAAPYDRLTSGLGAKIGAIFGVSCDTVLNGADGQFQTEGVHDLTKQAADDWTQGDRIYWDDSNKRCDNDPTVGMFIGYATETTETNATSGLVKLGGAPELLEGKQASIVDLTDSTGLSGTHDDTLAATTVPADLTGGESPTEAEHNALLAVIRVMAQNQSDVAQKIKELIAALDTLGLTA